MAKLKRRVEENSQERLDMSIHDGMIREELFDLLNRIRNTIRNRNSTRASAKLTDGYLESIAYKMLEHYDSMKDKEIAQKILEIVGKELIREHHGDKLDDLSKLGDSYRKGMKLLNKIHGKTLIEGNEKIPSNLSEEYLKNLLTIGYVSNETNLLFDEKVVDFLFRLGESDFATNRPKEYRKIINAMVIDQLENNPTLANDLRISQNRRLLDVAIQYVRTIDDKEDSNSSELEPVKVLRTIKNVFGDYIDNLSKSEKEYIEKKINKYSAFEFKLLKKDITAYASFADFMADADTAKIAQNPVAPHTPKTVVPVNSGSRVDNVMSDDDKFRGIQDAIIYLRQRNSRIRVGTVLVGVKEPFRGYMLFPLENVPYQIDAEEKGEPNEIGTNLLMSEIFGNTRGGALYIMTKQNADKVFSITAPNQIGTNNGPGTRTLSQNRPGLSIVHHYTGDGLAGYEGMVHDALDDMIKNSNINRVYRRPRKRIARPVGILAQGTSKTSPATVNTTPSTGATVRPFTIQTAPNSFDGIGVCVDDMKAVKVDPSEALSYTEGIFKDIKDKYADGNGLEDAKEFKLLDYVVEEMFIKGKSLQEIAQEMANTYGVDSMQAYLYIKSITSAMAELNPKHATETLKGLYKTEIERMTSEMTEMKLSMGDKEHRIEELNKRVKEIQKMYGEEGK